MRTITTIPQNEQLNFWQRYAVAFRKINLFRIIIQLISAATEASAIYLLAYAATVDLFPDAAKYIALSGMVMGVFFIEGILWYFLPIACKFTLHKERRKGLELTLNIAVILICLSALYGSTYFSFTGSKDGVKVISGKYKPENTAQIDSMKSIKSEKELEINTQYEKDKAEIIKQKEAKIKGINASEYRGSRAATEAGKSPSEIRAIAAAERLNAEKQSGEEIKYLTEQKDKSITYVREQFDADINKLSAADNEKMNEHNEKVAGTGGKLAYVTIVALFILIGITFLQEVFYKKSGIENKPLLSAADFRESAFESFSNTASEKWTTLLHNEIYKWAQKTPEMADPVTPGAITDPSTIEVEIKPMREIGFKRGAGTPTGNAIGDVKYCSAPNCRNRITVRRYDHQYCSEKCRYRAHRTTTPWM